MAHPIITIDGTSGVGKGTLAYRLAKVLGFQLLDSGAIYRLVGLLAYRSGLLSDEMVASRVYPETLDDDVAKLASSLAIDFRVNHQTQSVDIWLNGQPFNELLRTETIGLYGTAIAALPKVRLALLKLQQDTALRAGVVADGRDMGTVVFPKADVKFFLTASPEIRARRRTHQLIQAGETADYASILSDIVSRDEQNANRAVAPCVPADDAIIIDSSELSADEVFQSALDFCRQKGIFKEE